MTTAAPGLAERFRKLKGESAGGSLASRFAAIKASRGTFTQEAPDSVRPSHDEGEAYDPNALPENPDAAWAQAVKERGIDPIDAARVEGAVQAARGPQRPPMNLQGAGAPAGGVFDPIGFPNQEPAPLINPNDPSANVWQAKQRAQEGAFNQRRSELAEGQQAGFLGRTGAAIVAGATNAADEVGNAWGGMIRGSGVDVPPMKRTAGDIVRGGLEAIGAAEPGLKSEYERLASTATGPEQALAGLFSMPVSMLDPRAVAAILIMKTPALAGGATATEGVMASLEPALQAMQTRMGAPFTGMVRGAIESGTGLGGFSAVDSVLRGDDAETLGKKTLEGGALGVALGAPMGAAKMASGVLRERASAREASTPKPVPEPIPKEGDPARGAVDEQHQQAVEPHAAEPTKPRYTVVGYNEADGKPILRLNTQPEKGAPREVPQQEARSAELEPVNAGRESPAAPAAKEEAPPARQEVQGAPVEPAAPGGEAAVEGAPQKRRLKGKETQNADLGPAVEERPLAGGDGERVAPADRGVGVAEPPDVRPLETRVPEVVGDKGAPPGDQPGNVDVAPKPKARLRSKRAIEAERASLFEQGKEPEGVKAEGVAELQTKQEGSTPPPPPKRSLRGKTAETTPPREGFDLLRKDLTEKLAAEKAKPNPDPVKIAALVEDMRGAGKAGRVVEGKEAPRPPEAMTPSKSTWGGRIAEEAAARIKSRQVVRSDAKGSRAGNTTLFDDIIDGGIYLAGRWAEGGEKMLRKWTPGAKAAVVRTFPHLKDHTNNVMRVAIRLIRESRDKTGAFREDLAEASLQKINNERNKPNQTIKQTIREKTGQKRMEEKTVSGSEAMVHGLRSAEKAAAKAYREGKKAGLVKAERELGELHDRASAKSRVRALKQVIKEREKGRAVVEKMESEADFADGIRRDVVRLVNDHLPPAARGKFLNAAATADTMAKLRTTIKRVRNTVASVQLRDSIKDAARALRGANPAKMLEEHRMELLKAKAELETLRSKYEELKTYEARRTAAAQAELIRERILEARHRQTADQEVRVEGKVRKREEVVTEGVRNIEKRKPLQGREVLNTAKRLGAVGKIVASHLTPDSVGAMTGDKTLRRILSEDMWDGEDRVNADVKKSDDALRKIVEDNGYKWGADDTQKLSAAAARSEATPVTLHLPDRGEIKATAAELISLRNTLTDPEARSKLVASPGITWARDKRMKPIKITARDAAFIVKDLDARWAKIGDGMKGHIEKEVRPGVFAAFREQTGYDLQAAENYWPTRRNYEQPPPETLVHTTTGQARKALENLGFLKEREPDHSKPFVIRDAFDLYREHTHHAAVMTHMTARVRTAEMIFKDPRMRAAVESRYGADMVTHIDKVIENGKLIFQPEKTGFQRAVGYLNKAEAKALLTLNPKTWLTQLGGLAKLTAVIDPKYMMRGMKSLYSADVTRILKSEAFFRNRYEDAIYRRLTPSLGERGALLGQARVKTSARRLAMGGDLPEGSKRTLRAKSAATSRLGAMQDLTDRIEIMNTFDAVNARAAISARLVEARERGITKPEEWAGRMASYDIRRTNNTNSVLDMSKFAMDHRGDPLIGTTLLMFTSDQNKSLNMIVQGYHTGGVKGAMRAAAAVGVDNAWGLALAAGFAYLLTPGSGDQKGEAASKAAMRKALNLIPAYGADRAMDAMYGAYKRMTGDPEKARDFKLTEAPLLSSIEDLVKGTQTVAKSFADEGRVRSGADRGKTKASVDFAKGGKQLLRGAFDLAGLPVRPLWQMFDKATDEPEKRSLRGRR